MIDTDLKGKTALVTGGNSGIGAAISRGLASEGVRVAIHYLPQQPDQEGSLHTVLGRTAAERLVEEIRRDGHVAIAVGADLSDAQVPDALFDEIERKLGGVDILINNAAHCESRDTVTEIEAAIIDRHFAVNARAAVLLTQQLSQRMEKRSLRDGCVVNISTDGARAFAGQIAYGASKYALEGFTRSMAMELGPAGIRVDAIAPGPVQAGWITRDLEEEIMESIPLRSLGTPADIRDAVIFLCSKQARWITGQVLQVAGGHAL